MLWVPNDLVPRVYLQNPSEKGMFVINGED
jgi:hypothetical protein